MMPAASTASFPQGYWRSTEGIGAAQRRVETAVEELLPLIAAALDPGGQWSARFWRRGLGTFLWSLLSHCFDRASEPAPAQPAAVPALPEGQVFFSARDFNLALSEQAALQAWLDAVVDGRAGDPHGEAAVTAVAQWRLHEAAGGRKTPEAIERKAGQLRRRVLFWEGSGEVAHFAAPFSHWQSMQLSWKSGGRIRRLTCPEQVATLRYDGGQRLRLYERLGASGAALGELSRLALGPLCALMPTAFIEHREELATWAARQPRPRLLVTALGFERSPFFCALAERVEAAGGRVVGVQHGGCYGQTDPAWSEILENQNCDIYCTWGYRQRENHVALPAIRLAQIARARPPRVRGRRLLWAHAANVNGATLLAALPHFRRETELNDYFIDSVRAARERLGFEIALRPYPRIGVDALVQAWERGVPGLKLEPGRGRSLLRHAAEHDLTVFSFPGATGFLEFLQADRPALLFCPLDYCPVRPEAAEAFRALIDAGLFATDAASFERAVGDFLRERDRWWSSPERARARERFRAEFAQVGPDPCGTWARSLLGWAQAGDIGDRA